MLIGQHDVIKGNILRSLSYANLNNELYSIWLNNVSTARVNLQ